MTVVEPPGFLRDAATAMAESERDEVVSFLAANPDAGDVMPDTGGARKLRWRSAGAWQTGRISGDLLPQRVDSTVLLNVFAKNEKANLTKAERNELKALLPRLVAGYRKRMAK